MAEDKLETKEILSNRDSVAPYVGHGAKVVGKKANLECANVRLMSTGQSHANADVISNFRGFGRM
jgi:hypothetical protein